MRHIVLTVVFCLLVCGCSDAPVDSTSSMQGVINTHCPIMKEKVDPELTVDWNGEKVGLCCPPCLDEWKEMTDSERKTALKEAAATADDSYVPESGSGVL